MVSCGGGNKQNTAGASDEFKSESSLYTGYDLSKPVTIYLYMLGDVPADLYEVLSIANEKYFKPVLNTTVEMEFLGWSDYETKYPLILAGGDDVDIIYTASWAFYDQEAAKGAFVELTDDFISRWMPNIKRLQPANSWPQVIIGGKIFCVPRMYAFSSTKLWAIREDLREKYSLPPVTDWVNLENYLFTIAANERSLQAYASAGENEELMGSYMGYNRIATTNYPVFYSWNNRVRHEPDPEELEFLYMTDGYTNFALKMKEFAEKGVWSRNVMNNTTPISDAFVQGTSASVYWSEVVFTLGKNMETNGVGKVGYYDLTPDAPLGRAPYNGDNWAIASSSSNPERAALVLDLMKTNTDLVNLLMGGIEGRHYLDQKDGTFLPGPESAKYPFNGWAWALNYPDMLTLAFDKDSHPAQKQIMESIAGRIVDSAINLYRFDIAPVSAEWAVISSLVAEYSSSFDCGVFGAQTLAKLEEFRNKLKSAGLDKLTTEFRRQYAEFQKQYQ
ncbi:ABC transporter substrate-binding protein [Spirochaetia bacterium]|nr:ABC transporter substrate-binding protein [Spirochaetia bacterium]